MSNENAVTECQKEIRRLRSIIRENERLYSSIHLINVKAEPTYPGDPIADVMEEMWGKALSLNADELSFKFNGHTISIKQDLESKSEPIDG